MKKYILLLLVSFSFLFSACSQTVEDTEEFSGIIRDEQSFGYAYTVVKEHTTVTWKIGYKGDQFTIEESDANRDDLGNYMNAVNDSKMVVAKLILSVSYFVVTMITTLILYKKNRKVLKDSGVVISLLSGIAIYIAIKSSFDVSRILQEIKYYYLILTS